MRISDWSSDVCSSDLVTSGHAPQDPGLLLRRAELEDARREQEYAVLRHPCRAPGPVVLLPEEEPLPQRRASAAVLRGPGHGCPDAVEEASLPAQVLGEAVPGVARRRLPAAVGPPLGQVRLEPPPRLRPEPLLLRRPGQVQASPFPRSLDRQRPRLNSSS